MAFFRGKQVSPTKINIQIMLNDRQDKIIVEDC